MDPRIDDVRIEQARPLISPAILLEEIPRSEEVTRSIADWRVQADRIISGEDNRLLVVVGPCSIHDPRSAIEYAERLKPLADSLADRLFIVMRCYFEKPRTALGWKGFVYDPNLDGSHRINHGLREARRLLAQVAEIGLPAATEFLDMTVPQYISDLITWGCIGARTCESQPHRELASGLSMPIGFKNPTSGRLESAVDAITAAGSPHWFASNTKDGVASHFRSRGNSSCHMILRGGSETGPNYSAEWVVRASSLLSNAGQNPRVMVDASHANSGKDYRRQPEVVASLRGQLADGGSGLMGVMLESHLEAGSQPFAAPEALRYGQSITDGCLGFEETARLLDSLA